MAFTFSPETDRGKVRLLIHDTTAGTYGTDYDFSDADVDALLEQNSDSVWLAAADACRILAVKATSLAFVIKLPGALELDKRQVSERYKEMARAYEARASEGPDVVTEYVDSFAYGTSLTGEDTSEYIGD